MAHSSTEAPVEIRNAPVIAYLVSLNKFSFVGVAVVDGKLYGFFEPHEELKATAVAYDKLFNKFRKWHKGRGETPLTTPPFSLSPASA